MVNIQDKIMKKKNSKKSSQAFRHPIEWKTLFMITTGFPKKYSFWKPPCGALLSRVENTANWMGNHPDPFLLFSLKDCEREKCDKSV